MYDAVVVDDDYEGEEADDVIRGRTARAKGTRMAVGWLATTSS